MAAPIMFSYSIILTFNFILCLEIVYSFINIEELKSSAYEIDIWDKPLLYDESRSEDGVIVSSKLGQQYQCLYKDAPSSKDNAGEKEEENRDVSILLKPIEEGDCLKSTFGWWTYEFCYRKAIKQYHIENGEVIDKSISLLGFYSSDFDWKSEKMKTSDEHLSQYHSQSYVNGTLCDLTGRPRVTTVRFRCNFERGEVDQIVSLEEPATCEYILSISTSRICQLEYIKVLPARKSFPITCQPLLSASEFEEYTLEQKATEELLNVEKIEGDESVDVTLQNWEKWLSKIKSSKLVIVGMSSSGAINKIVTSIQEVLGVDGESVTPKILDNVEVQIVNSVADLAQVLEEFQNDVELGLKETQEALGAASEALDAVEKSLADTSTLTTEQSDAAVPGASVPTADGLGDDSASDNHPNSVTEPSTLKHDSDLTVEIVDSNSDPYKSKNPQSILTENENAISHRVDDTADNLGVLSNRDDISTNDQFTQGSNDVHSPSSLEDTSVSSASTPSDVNLDDMLVDNSNIPRVEHFTPPSEETPDDIRLLDSLPTAKEDVNNIPSVDTSSLRADETTSQTADHTSDFMSLSTPVDDSTKTTEASQADNGDESLLLKQIALIQAKILEMKAREQAASDAGGRPSRKLEVKVVNADYYNKDGKPVSLRPDRKVMAIFQNNDNEIQAYTKNRQLENNYNFKWTSTKRSKNRKETET